MKFIVDIDLLTHDVDQELFALLWATLGVVLLFELVIGNKATRKLVFIDNFIDLSALKVQKLLHDTHWLFNNMLMVLLDLLVIYFVAGFAKIYFVQFSHVDTLFEVGLTFINIHKEHRTEG